MGRSMATAGEAVRLDKPVSVRDAKFDRHYEVFSRDGALYQAASQTGSNGETVFRAEHKLEWAVGSGVNGFSFVARRGDHLFQAPLSYYARRGEWALSPGFEFADYGFSRPIHAACITCHSGRPRPVAGREARYSEPPFEELAIGCENCHGPGRAHATRRAPIVNPAKLAPRLAEDICMNCHQTGDTRVVQPGRQLADFRPGRPLDETVAIFRLASRAGEADLLEHHEAMKASRCYTGSAGKLGCLSCHNPHRMPATETEKPAYYRQRCNACHGATAASATRRCKVAAAKREEANGNDCAGCHMPERAVQEIAHSALTQHRISLQSGSTQVARREDPDLPGLLHLNRPPGKAPLPILTRLTAYGELLAREPALTPYYLDALERAAKEKQEDPLVLAALARKALREDRSGDALKLAEQAIAKGGSSAPLYYDVAEALTKSGRDADAIGRLNEGLALEPFSRDLRKALILRLINTRQYDQARRAMREYLDLFPEDGFMRGLLAKVDR